MTTHSGRGQGEEGPYEGVVLPADGNAWAPEQQGGSQPAPGTPWGTPWGPQPQAPPLPGAQPPADDDTHMLPRAQDAGQMLPAAQQPYGGQPLPPQAGYGGPPPLDADATQMMPPHPGAPPPLDADATQMMPPHPGTPPPGGDAEATRYMPRPPQAQPYADGSDATRMMPPQAPPAGRPLPPESSGDPRAAAGPPPASAPYGIRPGAPGDRQPPAEFDNLFRSEPASGPAGPPPPQQPGPASYPGPGGGPGGPAAGWQPAGGHGGHRDAYHGHDDDGDRRGVSPRVLIGVGVAALIAIGLVTGAALSGGDEEPRADGGTSATAPGDGGSAPADGDAEAQAKALDELLAQSNNSRNAVIGAVQHIKKCQNLQEASQDLRDAADQREGLVRSLGELKTGALPQHDALTSALTNAWKASAEADDAYAAWGDQVAGGKGCHKGKARATRRQAEGNRASGDASAAKKEAARLWNPIAREYGLDERQATQL